ncbi:sacsin N-terminal ATP-binding-like domain-containing protein [Amycolatopsis sacchari]|uniref:sacsin N-terminal ATP-binding-like domain-containing protein n=1 Tax=Amycolatopsis sacchari TaxID=115433 RepID=UPI003EBD8F71
MSSDPFGTEALRAAVLRAWADSPTRLTEDTNAERDLRVGAYRDRLFVELAQNAADAALAAGTPGTLRVSVVDGELRVANTGAPLDARGVASLSSLRASAKEGMVGQFGVGFAAVLAVTSEPRVISRTGGVAFSEARTREAVGRDDVPVLRLPWPVEEQVPEGFDTEVRLPLREGVDASELLARLADEVEDLLLVLPWLARVEVADRVWDRSEVDGVVEVAGRRWLTQEAPGGLWAVPVDGPLTADVLHAPTPTDERTSLPARLIAHVPLEPSRRRVLPGTELTVFAESYPALVRQLRPERRPDMVPRPGFPLSEVDAELRDAVVRQLSAQPWLPGREEELPGSGARVLDVESPELVDLLGEVVPRLVSLSGPEVARVLSAVGADPLGIAEVVEVLTGLERPPSWWRSLYDALLPLLEAHSVQADELGALPVPLADGRTLPGPRGAFLFGGSEELLDLLAEAEVVGLRLVHPEAAHPLLERLGAKQAESADLLEAPALREAVERSVEDALSGLDTRPLADAVLRLVSDTSAEGLGALALPGEDGWRRADELLLPTSPLLDVFDPEVFTEDGPFSLLDEDFAARWPREALVAVGVVDGFVVTEDGIRDLDLVADDAWPAALRLLAAERETWRALAGPSGEWLARNAVLAGRAPAEWRLPDADGLAGLYDPVPEVGVRPEVLALAGVRAELVVADLEDAADVLDRLGDPERVIAPGLVGRAYGAVAAAGLEWQELDPPERVRTVDGSVVAAEQAAVLDRPWLAAVWPAGRLVAVPEVGSVRRVGAGRPGVALAGSAAEGLAAEERSARQLAGGGPAGLGARRSAVPFAGDADLASRGPAAPGAGGPAVPFAGDAGLAGGGSAGRFAGDADLASGGPAAPFAGDADLAPGGPAEHASGGEGLPGLAERLAEVLDVPVLSELVSASLPEGEYVPWSELTAIRLVAELLDIPFPDGGVVVHEELTVEVAGVKHDAPWWVDSGRFHGEHHAADTPEGLARAFAWAAGRWEDRHLIAALLEEPDPLTLLT